MVIIDNDNPSMTLRQGRLAVGSDAVRGAISLTNPDAQIVVDVANGARLSSFRLFGRERLITEPLDQGPLRELFRGAYVMAPWAGRLEGGSVRHGTTSITFPRNLGPHAIHGLVAATPWRLVRADSQKVVASIDLASCGWPWPGTLTHTIRLDPEGVTLTLRVDAMLAMPVALGWHPWFRADDETRIRLTAAGRLVLRGDGIPTGEVLAVTSRDLATGLVTTSVALDDVLIGPRWPAVIAWPDVTLSIEADSNCTTAVIHTRAGAACIEPQTAWPNALRGDHGAVRVVVPGVPWTVRQRWRWANSAVEGRDRQSSDARPVPEYGPGEGLLPSIGLRHPR